LATVLSPDIVADLIPLGQIRPYLAFFCHIAPLQACSWLNFAAADSIGYIERLARRNQ
jgi:hypothetical protein